MRKRATSTSSTVPGGHNHEEATEMLSICSTETNTSGKQSSYSHYPIKSGPWIPLVESIQFIVNPHCQNESLLHSAKNTSNSVSLTMTQEEKRNILNDHADLYKLGIYVIRKRNSAGESHIDKFGGMLGKKEQEEYHRSVTFIIHDTVTGLFAPVYITKENGSIQTCFSRDYDEILNSINKEFGNGENSNSRINHMGTNDNIIMETTDQQNEVRPEPLILSTSNAKFDKPPPSAVADRESIHQNHNHTTTCIENLANRCETMDNTASHETNEQSPSFVQSFNLKPSTATSEHPEYQRHCLNNNTIHSSADTSQSTTVPTITNTFDSQIEYASGAKYNPLSMIAQPAEYQQSSLTKISAKNEFIPARNGETKKENYPSVEVPDGDCRELYVGVGLVTEDHNIHPSLRVASRDDIDNYETVRDQNEISSARFDPNGFDSKSKYILLRIDWNERQLHKKILNLRICHRKKYALQANQHTENENLRSYRFEVCLFEEVDPGIFQAVSLSIYTSVIKEVDGNVAIDPTKIEPKQLSKLGNEKIIIPLSAICKKTDLRIECNGRVIDHKNFKLERKNLTFFSPPKPPKMDDLHIKITRTKFVDGSCERIVKELYNGYLPYTAHDIPDDFAAPPTGPPNAGVVELDQSGSTRAFICKIPQITCQCTDTNIPMVDVISFGIEPSEFNITTNSTDQPYTHEHFQHTPETASDQSEYESLAIIRQPKSERHYRSMKELAKGETPHLSCEDPQQTSMRVSNPPKGHRRIYFAVEIRTYDDNEHPVKIIAPDDAIVDMKDFCSENNISPLQFDTTTKRMYHKISEDAYEDNEIEIWIYKINLYQNDTITTELIETKQLHKCKLPVQYYGLIDNIYRPMS